MWLQLTNWWSQSPHRHFPVDIPLCDLQPFLSSDTQFSLPPLFQVLLPYTGFGCSSQGGLCVWHCSFCLWPLFIPLIISNEDELLLPCISYILHSFQSLCLSPSVQVFCWLSALSLCTNPSSWGMPLAEPLNPSWAPSYRLTLAPSTTAIFHASLCLHHNRYPHWQADLFTAFESVWGICASGTLWAKGLFVCLASPNGFSACRFI